MQSGPGDDPDAQPDDGQDDSRRAADAFEVAFGQIYQRFHRRDGKRSELSGASRAVLMHLSLAGPLTVGEMADRRRTLVWLTDDGLALLAADRRVLSMELLDQAVATMSRTDRAALLRGVHALLATESPSRASKPVETKGER